MVILIIFKNLYTTPINLYNPYCNFTFQIAKCLYCYYHVKSNANLLISFSTMLLYILNTYINYKTLISCIIVIVIVGLLTLYTVSKNKNNNSNS
jgi:hypothetical protein